MRLLLLVLILVKFPVYAQLSSPNDFLGYTLGDRFTPHHRVIDYYENLGRVSSNVTLQYYGETYENRPLMLAFISSEENLGKLDEIRADNLKRSGLQNGKPSTDIPIIWLSYNVHGNESVSTEASMATIYELLANPNQDWLKNLIIVIDPCLNPDGRERYVNFYNQHKNQPNQTNIDSWEHREPWPGGRANHYLFDLNRDWAWMSQKESQQRLKVYNQWLPQIHVDFHEQGINSPYYFAPAAEPYHELITDWQRSFQVDIGKNHAKYFDEKGWLYFTKQYFDLLYPSYGDTYPTFNGAIGMTYEQGGSGRAGLGVITETGQTLTLKDRIDHHFTTGISTIEVAANNRKNLLAEFAEFFTQRPTTLYKTYVLKHNGDNHKMKDLMKWLDDLDIKYGKAAASKLSGYHFGSQQTQSFDLTEKDLVISLDQPKAVLTNVLFEPHTKLSDSLTYDITAWSVPLAYGLESYGLRSALNVKKLEAITFIQNVASDNTPYAQIFEWKNMAHASLLADLLVEDIKVRYYKSPVKINGQVFGRGSIVITRADNHGNNKASDLVTEYANKRGVKIHAVQSGFVQSGVDIGSNGHVSFLEKPKVALLGGLGTSSLNYGAVWHFLEQTLQYPIVNLSTQYFSQIDLNDYDVLILPDGRYSNFDSDDWDQIDNWVKSGGKLILLQGAIERWVAANKSSLKKFNDDYDSTNQQEKLDDQRDNDRIIPYASTERYDLRNMTAGSIFKVKLDDTHPLAYGYNDEYFSLKTDNLRYDLLKSGNVGYIANDQSDRGGFIGQNVIESIDGSLVFGVENRGGGDVVYFIDNPLFRSFWYDGKLLFANAVFFNP